MEELNKLNSQINEKTAYAERDEQSGVIQNDLDNLFGNCWIGGKRAATDKERLKKIGITHILNVTCQIENLFPQDFVYKQISINDIA